MTIIDSNENGIHINGKLVSTPEEFANEMGMKFRKTPLKISILDITGDESVNIEPTCLGYIKKGDTMMVFLSRESFPNEESLEWMEGYVNIHRVAGDFDFSEHFKHPLVCKSFVVIDVMTDEFSEDTLRDVLKSYKK